MQRRITFSVVDEIINDEKAIQPKEDDLVQELLAVIAADLKRDDDRERTTVIRVSVEKEVLTGATDSSKADHMGSRISDHPQMTAVKEAAVGDVAILPSKSDRRLAELIRAILNRIDELLFTCFLKELFKNMGGEVGKLLSKTSTWILIALLLWYLFNYPLGMTLAQLIRAVVWFFLTLTF